uniref:Uncharacterized protein n=1 Tax=Dunaliella tertiolecta TaxID=3047 RepID=A0A7S3VK13_DUNTE
MGEARVSTACSSSSPAPVPTSSMTSSSSAAAPLAPSSFAPPGGVALLSFLLSAGRVPPLDPLLALLARLSAQHDRVAWCTAQYGLTDAQHSRVTRIDQQDGCPTPATLTSTACPALCTAQ